MKLSKDQKIALDSLMDWAGGSPEKYITLGGYAGTGKSTLMGAFRKKLNKMNRYLKVGFCAYTGRAARVLKSKLVENEAFFTQDFVGTIHSLIYSPMENDQKEIVGWKLREREEGLDFDLIIIDEASMVDKNIFDDLLSFNIPIIAVGDHGQLPPVTTSYNNSSDGQKFNLMQSPILRLEKIHRQAETNPIILLSIKAREEGVIPFISFEGVRKISKEDHFAMEKIQDLISSFNSDLLVLCGFNYTRVKLNKMIRGAMEYEKIEPMVNDRVICLRNNREKQIYNGMLGRIEHIETFDDNHFQVEITMDGEEDLYTGIIQKDQFHKLEAMNFSKERYRTLKSDLFDFGYALTVHKAQGTQSKRVILFEERSKHMDDETWRRWLYTAVTRAEEELYIVA